MKLENKICVSIGRSGPVSCAELIRRYPLIELRIDLLGFDVEIESLVQIGTPAVLTYRPTLPESPAEEAMRRKILMRGIRAGARYVDIEHDASNEHLSTLLNAAHASDCQVMISSHLGRLTEETFVAEIESNFARGADLTKIVCELSSQTDLAMLAGMYAKYQRLIALGGGTSGRLSRILAPLLGAPFTYACADGFEPTASGQLSFEETSRALTALAKLTGVAE